MLHYKAVSRTRKQKLADIVLIIFGFVAAVYTTIQTLGVRLCLSTHWSFSLTNTFLAAVDDGTLTGRFTLRKLWRMMVKTPVKLCELEIYIYKFRKHQSQRITKDHIWFLNILAYSCVWNLFMFAYIPSPHPSKTNNSYIYLLLHNFNCGMPSIPMSNQRATKRSWSFVVDFLGWTRTRSFLWVGRIYNYYCFWIIDGRKTLREWSEQSKILNPLGAENIR